MARVELDDSWLVRGDVDAVRELVLDFLDRQGMTVTGETDDEVRAAQGSQLKTRLLGGWFVSAATLPKRATVTVEQTKKGVRITALIEESMGFGFLDPILTDKYRQYFAQWMDDLQDELELR